MKRLLMFAILLTFTRLVAQQSPPKTDPSTKPPNKPSPQQNAQPRARVQTNLQAFELAPAKKVEAVAGSSGASRFSPDKHLLPLAPHRGATYSELPTFYWFTGGTQRKFTVAVYRENGDEIYRGDVEGLRFQYPATATPLEGGNTYYWTVEYRNASLTIGPSDPTYFLVLAEADRKRIGEVLTKAGNDMTAQAQTFCEQFVWYDCVSAYNALIVQQPGNAGLYEARANVYGQVESTSQLSREDRERSEQLKAGTKK